MNRFLLYFFKYVLLILLLIVSSIVLKAQNECCRDSALYRTAYNYIVNDTILATPEFEDFKLCGGDFYVSRKLAHTFFAGFSRELKKNGEKYRDTYMRLAELDDQDSLGDKICDCFLDMFKGRISCQNICSMTRNDEYLPFIINFSSVYDNMLFVEVCIICEYKIHYRSIFYCFVFDENKSISIAYSKSMHKN